MIAHALPSLLLLASATAVGAWVAVEDGPGGHGGAGRGSPAGGSTGLTTGGWAASAVTESRSSTWYCPAGTAGEPADHVVVVDNATSEKVSATVTVISERAADGADPSGHETHHEFEISPFRKQRFPLADLYGDSDGRFLAAVVELDGAHSSEVQVEHVASAAQGEAAGPCATGGASEWHLAWGATTRDARDMLVLFNPFPNDVVVDAAFSTPEGLREPLRWQGLTVPARRVVAIDVGQDVTRRSHVAASIRARTGSVVVERLQIFDGSLDREGTRLALGQPAPVAQATFSGVGREELVAVYNPTDEMSEVEVRIRPDDPREPEPLPFALVLRPGEFETLDYSQEGRVPSGRYETLVRSTNDVPIVAEQVLLAPPSSPS